jgi:hypothetical protein
MRARKDIRRQIQRIPEAAVRLFAAPLTFDAGALVLSSGFQPVIDRAVLATQWATRRSKFAEACAPGSAAGAQE